MLPRNNNQIITPFLVAIIVVGFNNEKSIRECLYSVFKNFLGKNPVKGKIIFIDNKSSDKTVPVVLKLKEFYPYIDVIENKTNLGFAKAVNQGIKIAQEKYNPDFFLFLNPDAKIETESLINKMVERASFFSKPVIASPRITRTKIENLEKARRNHIWFEGGRIDWRKQKVLHESPEIREIEKVKSFLTEFVSGCAMFINKKTIEKIGLLDERFFLFYEDADFCLRAKKHGGKLIIFPDLEICHIESVSFNKENIKTYHLVKSGLLFFHKHSSGWKRFLFWIRFYGRLFYHKFHSKKSIVLKAMKNFREEIKSVL